MNYYVYTLAYPNATVFYVGKGKGKLIADHEKEALRGHNCPKCELIRSIWRQGGTIQRAIVFETDDERAALDREADLIRHYGPTQLVNHRGSYLFRSTPTIISLNVLSSKQHVSHHSSHRVIPLVIF